MAKSVKHDDWEGKNRSFGEDEAHQQAGCSTQRGSGPRWLGVATLAPCVTSTEQRQGDVAVVALQAPCAGVATRSRKGGAGGSD